MWNKLFMRLGGVFGAILILISTCGFGPFRRVTFFQNPLLKYIYPEKRVSDREFTAFLEHLSGEQRNVLWKTLSDKKLPYSITVVELEKELLWMSSHWGTYMFKTKPNYQDIVEWTAQKMDVPKAVCDYATTFQLERRICEVMFEKMWNKLTAEQRKKLLKEVGMDPHNISGYAALTGSAFIAALSASSILMGFPFYILMAKTVVVVAASIGIAAPATISTIALLCGPVGWCIAGASAVTGGLLLGRANIQKTAAFVIQTHLLKVNTMEKSGVNIEQYLLK